MKSAGFIGSVFVSGGSGGGTTDTTARTLATQAKAKADALTPDAGATVVGPLGPIVAAGKLWNVAAGTQTMPDPITEAALTADPGFTELETAQVDEIFLATVDLTGQAAPTGAKEGRNTTTGQEYYVSGGVWVAETQITSQGDRLGADATLPVAPTKPGGQPPMIGDWFELTAQDGVNVPGIYAWAGGALALDTAAVDPTQDLDRARLDRIQKAILLRDVMGPASTANETIADATNYDIPDTTQSFSFYEDHIDASGGAVTRTLNISTDGYEYETSNVGPTGNISFVSLNGTMTLDGVTDTEFTAGPGTSIRWRRQPGGYVGTTVSGAVDTAPAFTVAIDGLTNNPTHGATAQVGSVVTANVTGLVGGEVVTYQWYDGSGDLAGQTVINHTVSATSDTSTLGVRVVIDGTPFLSPGATVRQIPPTAGTFAPYSGVQGSGPHAVDLTTGFTGVALTFSDVVPFTMITGNNMAIADAAISSVVTVTATNSGGSITNDLTVNITAVPSGDTVISPDAPDPLTPPDIELLPYESKSGQLLELRVNSLPAVGAAAHPYMEYQLEIPGAGWSNWYVVPWGWRTGTRVIKTFSSPNQAVGIRVRTRAIDGPGQFIQLAAQTPSTKQALAANTLVFGADDPVGYAGVPTTAPDGTYANGEISVTGGVATRLTSPLTPGSFAAGGETFEVVADSYAIRSQADFAAIYDLSIAQASGKRALIAPGLIVTTPAGIFNDLINLTAPLVIENMDVANPGGTSYLSFSSTTSNVGPIHIKDLNCYRASDPDNFEAANPTFGSKILDIKFCNGMRIEGCEIHSDILASGDGFFAQEAVEGVSIASSVDSQVIDNEFHNLFYNVAFNGRCSVDCNIIRDSYADAINPLGGNDDQSVTRNTCYDFTGDASQIHPDMCQFRGNGLNRNFHMRDNTMFNGDLSKVRPSNDPFLGADGNILSADGSTFDAGLTLAGAGNVIALDDMCRAFTCADGAAVQLPDFNLCQGQHVSIRPFNNSASVTVNSTGGQTHATLAFPFVFTGAYNEQGALTFRAGPTGWERQTPGLRTGTMILPSQTLGRWAWTRIIYGDNTAGTADFITNPAPTDGENFYLGPVANGNATTLTASPGQSIVGVGVTGGVWTSPTLRSVVKATYTAANSTWTITEAPLVIQGIFANNIQFVGYCTFQGNVVVATAAWANRIPDTSGVNDPNTRVLTTNNFFGQLPIDDLDASGSIGPNDGFPDTYQTGIFQTYNPRHTAFGNIASQIDNIAGVAAKNELLGIGRFDAENYVLWTDVLERPLAELRSPSTAAAALAATQLKSSRPLASIAGPLNRRTSAGVMVDPPPFVVESDNTTNLPANLPIEITMSLPVRKATVTLTNTTTSAVEPATVTTDGLKIVIEPTSALDPAATYEVTSAVDSIVSAYDTGTPAPISVTFQPVAAQAGGWFESLIPFLLSDQTWGAQTVDADGFVINPTGRIESSTATAIWDDGINYQDSNGHTFVFEIRPTAAGGLASCRIDIQQTGTPGNFLFQPQPNLVNGSLLNVPAAPNGAVLLPALPDGRRRLKVTVGPDVLIDGDTAFNLIIRLNDHNLQRGNDFGRVGLFRGTLTDQEVTDLPLN